VHFNAEPAREPRRASCVDECRAIDVTEAARNASASPVFRLVLFYFLRRFHDWAELMRDHEPRMAIVTPSSSIAAIMTRERLVLVSFAASSFCSSDRRGAAAGGATRAR
jgi:hypothetical protein